MKRELKNYLENFGLSEMQAEVYLLALKSGPLKVADIVRTTGYKRISCYAALERLKSLLLVREEPKKYGRKITAAPPTSLKTLLGEQKRKLRKLELGFDRLLPEFEQLKKLKLENHDTSLSFFEGKEAVKRVWMGPMLDEGVLLRGLTTEKVFDRFPELFTEFIPKRIEQKVFLKVISPNEPGMHDVKHGDSKSLRETRIIKGEFPLESDIVISEQSVYITNWFDPIFCVVIKNPFVVKNFSVIFNTLWNSLEH